ncbi:MAG: hypothetical protein AAF669_09220, partial [Pseudomonadota bacterium]
PDHLGLVLGPSAHLRGALGIPRLSETYLKARLKIRAINADYLLQGWKCSLPDHFGQQVLRMDARQLSQSERWKLADSFERTDVYADVCALFGSAYQPITKPQLVTVCALH